MGVIDCVDGSSIVYFGIKPSHRKLITSENNRVITSNLNQFIID